MEISRSESLMRLLTMVGVALTATMFLASCSGSSVTPVASSSPPSQVPSAPTTPAAVAPAPTTPAAVAPAPTTPAAVAPAPTTPAAVAPAPTTPAGCYPKSDEGTCYEPGEYCRDVDHGTSGVAGDGEAITCEDNDGWRWEPA
jgi:hypothetical protein